MKKVSKLICAILTVIMISVNGGLTTVQMTVQAAQNTYRNTIVSAGVYHTLALKNDGTVWGWGDNQYGQLAIKQSKSTSPVKISGLDNIISVSAGLIESVALRSDGTVWALGGTPTKVEGLTGVIDIAAGYYNDSLALKSDGTVWSWGSIYETPEKVSNISGIIAIADGYTHSIALDGDGTVWAWGQVHYTGNNQITSPPQKVPGLSGVIAISAGQGSSIYLKSDGTVWSDDCLSTPSKVDGLSNIVSISEGAGHNLAIDKDGSVWSWGYNSFGELGNGQANNSYNTPAKVSGISKAIAVSGGRDHSVIVVADGTIWTCGSNYYGQLGDGADTNSNIPAKINAIAGVSGAAIRDGSVLVREEDRTVWGWGNNQYGQLGDNTGNNTQSPVQAKGLTDVVQIVNGPSHSVALKGDGTVWAWGSCINSLGYYGILLAPVQVGGISDVISIAEGYDFTVALKNDGTVWAWGQNSDGQLGNGTNNLSSVPVQVSGLNSIIAISTRAHHTLALKNDGTVWGWGMNYAGQLGDGTTNTRSSPVKVSSLSQVTAIAAGSHHSLALKSDGTVWGWGANSMHQLGDSNEVHIISAQEISGISDVRYIFGGENASIFQKNDKSFWIVGGMGSDFCKQPVQFTSISNLTYMTSDYYNVLAIKNDGTIWIWGDNEYGQLANGEAYKTWPTRVNGITAVAPMGSLDSPAAGATINGAAYNISGWFLDPFGVSKIEVLVDGAVKGTAVYGDSRAGVGALFPAYNNNNCGYHYSLDTTKLTNGTHSIVIRETGTNGIQTSLAARSVTVSNIPPAKGSLDTPTAGATISGITYVSGWFLDGSNVSKIEILVDGAVNGTAIYGDSRPGVGALFPEYNNNNCGYHYSLDTTKLTNGTHTITVRETGGNSLQTSLPVRSVTVSNSLPAKGCLDTPAAGATVSAITYVSGWFLDGSGVNKVEVLVDGAVKGTAVYGDSRPGVGALFPDYNNNNCGYHYSLDTTKLTNGTHTIVIRETGANSIQTSLPSRSFTVSNALPAKGSLDLPAMEQTISGTYNVCGWFLDGSGVSKIEVLVGDTVVGTAIYGDPRPGVGALFPDYHNNNCGYHYSLDTMKISNGTHTITIRETGGNSVQTSLPAKKVIVLN